jgi:hypothetical protein
MNQILLQRQRELAIGKIRVVLEMEQLKRAKYRKAVLKEYRKAWCTGASDDELARLKTKVNEPQEYDDVVVTLSLSNKDYQYIQKYRHVWEHRKKLKKAWTLKSDKGRSSPI